MNNANRKKFTSLHQGQIREVYYGHKRKAENQRPYCKILMDSGDFKDNVPFYGAAVDVGLTKEDQTEEGTGRPHGTYFPPFKGQKVLVQYVNGNFENPYCVAAATHPWLLKDAEKTATVLKEVMPDIEDGGVFHKSGSYTVYKKNGDVITITGDVTNGELNFKIQRNLYLLKH
jgi:hypothetical protein